MATSGKKLLIGAAAAALLAALALPGCGRREPGPVAKPVVGKAVTVPAKSVRFHLLKPGREERSGLYAMAEVQTPELPELFGLLAGGKVMKPVAGKPLMLVGKLPGTVNGAGFDFFQSVCISCNSQAVASPTGMTLWELP